MPRDLNKLLGREHDLDDVNRALRDYVRALDAPVVGAMHITCADESEYECIDSFQRRFVNDLLPDLKFARRAPFRLSNLGGRYEEGALAVAEHHYATPQTHDAFKVLLVKINAHVAIERTGAAARFGRMQRYDTESTACGALHALLDGKQLPALNELRETFESEGVDRLTQLLDPSLVHPQHRSLFVALVNARLQTRRAEQAIQDHTSHSPTLYLVASCVTLNRPEQDTELLCGLYTADQRGGEHTAAYIGLGDDPIRYEVHDDFGRLRVSDNHLSAEESQATHG
ncbi:MAG: hypothetical protein KAY37_12660 [Phycisphaerae bacterium]|nr:hypothetical protein [Phycisphaerae bacterium]